MSDPACAFVRRVVTIEPGGVLGYDEADWLDAIVFVADGEVVLECVRGHSRRFGAGHILWLEGLPLRCVRNPRAVPARLVAVSRYARSVRRSPSAGFADLPRSPTP
jgi:glyoxylate utilization-related uncharacterized protein